MGKTLSDQDFASPNEVAEILQMLGNGVNVRQFPKSMAESNKHVKRTQEILSANTAHLPLSPVLLTVVYFFLVLNSHLHIDPYMLPQFKRD
ncbi:heat shock 70 kDa protein 17 [Artemisia annua]|uniref:Heat shock 70 kDa protein 17 n=1 Tax=Artemisia annua TaxID=35608 RepID=A0A2U1MSS9_ARTAN|nr:heat shock 70 kDa protein 17 [Artemisia annua]